MPISRLYYYNILSVFRRVYFVGFPFVYLLLISRNGNQQHRRFSHYIRLKNQIQLRAICSGRTCRKSIPRKFMNLWDVLHLKKQRIIRSLLFFKWWSSIYYCALKLAFRMLIFFTTISQRVEGHDKETLRMDPTAVRQLRFVEYHLNHCVPSHWQVSVLSSLEMELTLT